MKSQDQEKKAIDTENEKQYQQTKSAPASKQAVREEGMTDGNGNYVASINGVYTEAQQAQFKAGNWIAYTKDASGAYSVSGKPSANESKKK